MIDSRSILHIAETFSYGGTEKTMQILCSELVRRGVRVHAAAWVGGGAREGWVRERVTNVTSFGASPDRLRDYISKHNIALVHVHRSHHGMRKVLEALQNVDVVVVETNAFGKITGHACELRADYRLFVSAFCATRFYRMYSRQPEQSFWEHAAVLYNPIDPDDFPSYTRKYIEAYRRSLGIHADERIICRVGRADNAKFGDMVILMLPHLIRHVPNVRLILQSAPDRIRQLSRRLGVQDHVVILPETASTEALGLLYASSECMAHASLIGETFGCSMAEAMLYGMPVVVNATPYFDNAQIEVIDNARTGYVVDNPKSFAEAVAALLLQSELRAQFGKAGREKVFASYASSRVCDQLERIYDRALHAASVADLSPSAVAESLSTRKQDLFHPRPILARYYRYRNILQKRYIALCAMAHKSS